MECIRKLTVESLRLMYLSERKASIQPLNAELVSPLNRVQIDAELLARSLREGIS